MGGYFEGNQVAQLIDALSGVFAFTSSPGAGLGDYLPLTGGTITGNLAVNGSTSLPGVISATEPASPTAGMLWIEPTVTAWYRAGGMYAPLAVYKAKGAASYAASLVNLVTPGTLDAIEIVAPTWNASTGWSVATNKALRCPYQLLSTDDHNLTMMIRVANVVAVAGANVYFCGGITTATEYFALTYNSDALSIYWMYNNQVPIVDAALTSGVLCIADTVGYRDGVVKTSSVTGTFTANGHANGIAIGARTLSGGTYDRYASCDILDWAIWKGTPPTGAQVAALSSALAAS